MRNGEDVRILDHHPPRVDGASWIGGDVGRIRTCETALSGVEAIIHLAAPTYRPKTQQRALEYLSEVSVATSNLLSMAIKQNVAHLILTSTGGVYGNTSLAGATENSKCRPVGPYALGKYTSEKIALSYRRVNSSLKLSVLRLFNTFGEWQLPNRSGAAVATFVVRALRGKQLLIHGTGHQVRDLLYVGDVAAAYEQALRVKVDGVFNLASGKPRSVLSVAGSVIRQVGHGNIMSLPDPRGSDQVNCSVGVASSFTKATGWKPIFKFGAALA